MTLGKQTFLILNQYDLVAAPHPCALYDVHIWSEAFATTASFGCKHALQVLAHG